MILPVEPGKTVIKHEKRLVPGISSLFLKTSKFFRKFSFCSYNDTIFISGLFVVVDSVTFSKPY